MSEPDEEKVRQTGNNNVITYELIKEANDIFRKDDLIEMDIGTFVITNDPITTDRSLTTSKDENTNLLPYKKPKNCCKRLRPSTKRPMKLNKQGQLMELHPTKGWKKKLY